MLPSYSFLHLNEQLRIFISTVVGLAVVSCMLIQSERTLLANLFKLLVVVFAWPFSRFVSNVNAFLRFVLAIRFF